MGCSNGKVALVTGAGQGVGAGIALALAKEGAAVALVGRRREPLAATAREAESAGARTHVIICDVTDRASVNAAVAETRAALGPVWVLVNNAVSTEDKPLEEVDDESLDLVIKSGIYGSLYAMQACFPDMKARGGRIVNLGSGAATVGLPEVGAYAIAKEGIRGLTKVAAASWGKYDITANTICPMVTSPLYNRCGRPGPKPSARGTWKRFHAADGRRRK